jgi:23S rRNA (cytosine1962-C5)-methyltransferase
LRHDYCMAGIVVKPRARILHGHDWVFSSEVLKIFGKPADGDVISLKDGRDHLIGSAIYNSKSQIVARRFSRRKQDLDLDLFNRRIAQAAEYRARRGVDPKLCRVVWSESDGLPGVILDRYGDYLVLQTLTLGMDTRKDLIITQSSIFLATSQLSSAMTWRFAVRKVSNCAAAFYRETFLRPSKS